jgi:hypothetical protein
MQCIHLNELDWLRFGKIRLQEFCYSQFTYYFVYHILLLWSKGPQINLPLAPKNLKTTLVPYGIITVYNLGLNFFFFHLNFNFKYKSKLH